MPHYFVSFHYTDGQRFSGFDMAEVELAEGQALNRFADVARLILGPIRDRYDSPRLAITVLNLQRFPI